MVGSTSICYRRDQSLQDVLVKGLGSVKGGGWELVPANQRFRQGSWKAFHRYQSWRREEVVEADIYLSV